MTGKYKGQIACGGNRIGKTELGAYICALVVTGEHPTYASPKNGRMWVIGLDSKVVDAVNRPKFEMFIPERYKAGGEWSAKQQRWVLSADGRTWEVFFKYVESGRVKFQNDKINFAWIDEEPHKTEIFTEIETRLVDLQGLWLMTATPVMGTRWLKEMTERLDVFTTFAGMRENPHIPLDEVERLAKQLPEDERLVRVEGQYVVYGGRPVFDYNGLDRCAMNVAYKTGTLAAVA